DALAEVLGNCVVAGEDRLLYGFEDGIVVNIRLRPDGSWSFEADRLSQDEIVGRLSANDEFTRLVIAGELQIAEGDHARIEEEDERRVSGPKPAQASAEARSGQVNDRADPSPDIHPSGKAQKQPSPRMQRVIDEAVQSTKDAIAGRGPSFLDLH